MEVAPSEGEDDAEADRDLPETVRWSLNPFRFRGYQPFTVPVLPTLSLPGYPQPRSIDSPVLSGGVHQTGPRRWWHRQRPALPRRAVLPYYRSIFSQQSLLIRVIRQPSEGALEPIDRRKTLGGGEEKGGKGR